MICRNVYPRCFDNLVANRVQTSPVSSQRLLSGFDLSHDISDFFCVFLCVTLPSEGCCRHVSVFVPMMRSGSHA